MPRRQCPRLIAEDSTTLILLEQPQRGPLTHPRIRLPCLLKSGQVPSLRVAAPLLRFSLSQLSRWWTLYQPRGVEPLLAIKLRGHGHPRLTEPAWDGLCAQMRAGEIATIKDTQRYLADAWQISYSLSGLWWNLHRRRARVKTGGDGISALTRRAKPRTKEAFAPG